jgi:hypothetical protein
LKVAHAQSVVREGPFRTIAKTGGDTMHGDQWRGWGQWRGGGFDGVDDPRLANRRAAAEAQREVTARQASTDADRGIPDADARNESRDLIAVGVGLPEGR